MSDTWLFGYGSIMWKTGFEFEASERCRVDGWARRFWQGSTDHRGTPEFPGRVVTLIPSPGEACFGLAYRLPASRADTIIEELDYREKGGYDKVRLDLHLHSGTRVSGLTYIAHDHNPHFVGDAPLEQIAGHILKSTGPSGSNKEYILQLQQSLLQHDITDQHVEALARLVIEKAQSTP